MTPTYILQTIGRMGQRGQDRAGIPLSVKLMLTTSIVVAAAVGASAYFGSNNIRELARSDAAVRRASGNESIKRESELLASNIAAAAAIPLAQQAYGEVGPAPRSPPSRRSRPWPTPRRWPCRSPPPSSCPNRRRR